MGADATELRDRWSTTVRRAGVAGTVAGPLLAELCDRYSEPQRRYHDLTHVLMTLRTLERTALSAGVGDTTALELAVWFHDVIYRPDRPGNEAASAELAAQRLHGSPLVLDVQRLVLVTAAHRSSQPDEAALCDADLAILAATSEIYELYRLGVRREYAHVSDAQWRVGRAAVLEHLLAGPVFATAVMADAEAAAHRNLGAELAALRGSTGATT